MLSRGAPEGGTEIYAPMRVKHCVLWVDLGNVMGWWSGWVDLGYVMGWWSGCILVVLETGLLWEVEF